jgi:hypothetical protein
MFFLVSSFFYCFFVFFLNSFHSFFSSFFIGIFSYFIMPSALSHVPGVVAQTVTRVITEMIPPRRLITRTEFTNVPNLYKELQQSSVCGE